MKTIGNVIWLVFGGCIVGLAYLVGTVIFFPLAWYLSPFIGYAFWPFGRRAVRLTQINQYKADKGLSDSSNSAPNIDTNLRRVLGIVWALTFGWVMSLGCIVFALIHIPLFATLILIPVAIANMGGWLKLAKVSLNPFSYRPINSHLADEIEAHVARGKL